MTWLMSKVGGWLAAAGAVIVLLFGVWARGRQAGKDALREEQERHKAEARALKRKIDSETDDLAPADLDHNFQRWVRRDER